jgi:hypothetical protein
VVAGGSSAIGEQLAQVSDGESGWDGAVSDAVDEQVDDGGVGPQGDGLSGPVRAEPELLAADCQVARPRSNAGDLDSEVDRFATIADITTGTGNAGSVGAAVGGVEAGAGDRWCQRGRQAQR